MYNTLVPMVIQSRSYANMNFNDLRKPLSCILPSRINKPPTVKLMENFPILPNGSYRNTPTAKNKAPAPYNAKAQKYCSLVASKLHTKNKCTLKRRFSK